ncbi:darcynin family protein [Nitrospirillum sp. BR 11164]|uniref:darcynin family protein n=1 Tax=Nitrospirillum sp. BR 11164 TaxID=3104324 RepID=UPI002AFEB46C|nr:darcynin family protein [Nitrospirillum sp. BR 11164]MEA1651523.1 darcynin family protein [Nitrospirillum sp. BR 11164]
MTIETREGFRPALTVFMLVKSLPEWLALPGEQRRQALAQHVEPVLARYRDDVRLRFYDVEFYSAAVTDVWVWEARSHEAYQHLVEDLRDTPFWDRYFQISNILPGVANPYGGTSQAA